ncbi:MAG: hypothetical protein AAGL66_15860, partial [Pseudomonadota bacterium]
NLRHALELLGQVSATAPAASTRELVGQAVREWTRVPLIHRQGQAYVSGSQYDGEEPGEVASGPASAHESDLRGLNRS